MFTGIVEEVGEVRALERDGERARLEIACREVVVDADLGDSIAVDGCCVTVTELLPDGGFAADLMVGTLRTTVLGDLEPGDTVNLERPLAADGRFGGHLVQGHVDGVGEVLDREDRPGTVTLRIRAPEAVRPYLVPKGSVTVQGVSLTVGDVDDGAFTVGLIPHTCEVTTLGRLGVGDRLNLEADVIAKYVQSFVRADES